MLRCDMEAAIRRNGPAAWGFGTLSHGGEFPTATLPTCNIDPDLHIFATASGRDIQNRGQPQGG
jgi:hypothetical protein